MHDEATKIDHTRIQDAIKIDSVSKTKEVAAISVDNHPDTSDFLGFEQAMKRRKTRYGPFNEGSTGFVIFRCWMGKTRIGIEIIKDECETVK